MFISNLKVINYRNFTDFEVKLKPFTLIIGENNVGKTNILNAIGLIFSQEITIFKKRFLEIDDFNYNTIKKFKSAVIDQSIKDFSKIQLPIVKIEVVLKDFSDEQAAIIGEWCIDKHLSEAMITYEFAPQVSFKKDEWIKNHREKGTTKWEDIDFPIEAYEYSLYGGNNSSNRCDLYFLRMLKMEFLDALRDAKKELVANSDNRLLYKILSRKEITNYTKIKNILDTLNSEIHQNANLSEIKTEVNSILDKVSLEDSNTINEIGFDFTSPETSEILKKLSLTYGSDPISVDRNGLGRNNLLYISLLLSQIIEEKNIQHSQSIRDFTAYRLIAVEEPEAHLHPNLQNHLAENIEEISTNKNHLQLILTSHSSHITSKLSLENTLILFREKDNIQSHYILDGLDISKSDDKESVNYLTKYLDATKSTMFFSRKIILVEGIAEQLLIPALFERITGKTLEKTNCTIVNVNGVAFKHFLKVIKSGFFIKCLVLTDDDDSERADNLKDEYKSINSIRIEKTMNYTFELDLIHDNTTSKNGKEIMAEAIIRTRRNSGKILIENLQDNPIVPNDYFELIYKKTGRNVQNYKSEFAMNLADVLTNEKFKTTKFNIPSYIESGIKFLTE